MKMVVLLCVGAVGVLLGVLIGYGIARGGASAPQLIFDNQSGQPVLEMVLQSRMGPLPVGAGRVLPFQARGDGGYDLKVTFADGKQASLDNAYVEGGVRQTIVAQPGATLTIK